MSSTEVERLYSKNLEELYEELGRALIAPGHPETTSITIQNAVQRGKSFISGSLEKLRARICVDWGYCSRRNDYGDFQSLAYAIAPLVSSAVGVPVATAMIVVIILIKSGLDKLCNCP
jgi:hypothetical protein